MEVSIKFNTVVAINMQLNQLSEKLAIQNIKFSNTGTTLRIRSNIHLATTNNSNSFINCVLSYPLQIVTESQTLWLETITNTAKCVNVKYHCLENISKDFFLMNFRRNSHFEDRYNGAPFITIFAILYSKIYKHIRNSILTVSFFYETIEVLHFKKTKCFL